MKDILTTKQIDEYEKICTDNYKSNKRCENCELHNTVKCFNGLDAVAVMKKYAKALEQLQEANRWRDVNEELPEENVDVWISSGDTKRIMTDYLLKGKFVCYGENVKYWMPQTITPPKEG